MTSKILLSKNLSIIENRAKCEVRAFSHPMNTVTCAILVGIGVVYLFRKRIFYGLTHAHAIADPKPDNIHEVKHGDTLVDFNHYFFASPIVDITGKHLECQSCRSLASEF